MRMLLALTAILTLVGTTAATDLGHHRPPKPQFSAPPVEGSGDRQGGDTILDAVEISIPYSGVGSTIGYIDDYDEACPYTGSTSPDVVYRFHLFNSSLIDIDLYGSLYDTKVYVYDENLDLVACNDDFYSDYTSRIEALFIQPGDYFVVIDGYGGDAGEYVLLIDEWIIEVLPCPFGADLESEPPLVDEYVDAHNGGCNSLGDLGYAPFQAIDSRYFCGVAGWYICDGDACRDTDWFTLILPASGSLSITADAEYETAMFELGPQNCDEVGVVQSVEFGPFWPHTMIITGEPGETVWLWVGSTSYESPGGANEYDYVLDIPQVVPVEQRSWSAVKGLFDRD